MNIPANQDKIILMQWESQQKKYSIKTGEIEKSITAIINNFGLSNKAVSIILIGKKKMKALNKHYRGIDDDTDVLAFPVDVDYHDQQFLGDIFICSDIAYRQAKSYGHSIDKEISILVLHGILHLLGYDHLRDRGEMARIENYLRKYL